MAAIIGPIRTFLAAKGRYRVNIYGDAVDRQALCREYVRLRKYPIEYRAPTSTDDAGFRLQLQIRLRALRAQLRNPEVQYEIEILKGIGRGQHITRQSLKRAHYSALNRVRNLRSQSKCTQTHTFKVGENIMVGGTYTADYPMSLFLERWKEARAYSGKRPMTDDKYVGIEIEIVSASSDKELIRLFDRAKLLPYIQIKGDGSIRTNAELSNACDGCGDDGECDCGLASDERPHKHEIAVLVRESEYRDIVPRICAVLREADCDTNSSCGLHIHLDMRHRLVHHAWRNLVLSQSLLFALVPQSRRTSEWAQRVEQASFTASMDLPGRYWAINPKAHFSHGTLEVRLHTGTVQATKIINWIALLVAIADAPPMNQFPRTLAGVKRRLGLAPALVEYLEERIRAFNPDRGLEGIPFLNPGRQLGTVDAPMLLMLTRAEAMAARRAGTLLRDLSEPTYYAEAA